MKPRLAVESVWILEEVLPYEGNEILGVFIDPMKAQKDRRGRWSRKVDPESGEFWTTRTDSTGMNPFYLLTKHPVRGA